MREQLRAYVQHLFDRAADTPRNRELLEEILQNTLDRYDDLVAQGTSEADAYQQAVSQIGEVEKLWEPGLPGRPKAEKQRHGWARFAEDVTALAMGAVDQARRAGLPVGKSTVRYSQSERYTVGGSAVPADGIEQVKVSWIQGLVTVVAGQGDAILVEEEGPADYPLCWCVQGDTLDVQFVQAGVYLHLPDKHLTLTLPRQLAKLKVETVSADTELDHAPAQTLKLETVSGNGKIDGQHNTFSWQSVSGDLEFRGTAATVKSEAVSGDIELQLSETPDTLQAESVSGDVEVRLPRNRSFDLRYDTVSGEYTCALTAVKEGKRHWRYEAGGEPAKLKLETVSGDLSVQAAD